MAEYSSAQLAKGYFKLRATIAETEARHTAELAPLKEDLKTLEQMLAEQLHTDGLTSVKVDGAGTVGFQTSTVYKAEDITSLREYALESGNVELLSMSLSSTGVKAYLEANGELPPGVFPTELEKLYYRPSRKG